MNKFPVKTLAATAAGILLFFLFGRYVSFPGPAAGTRITLQYGVTAFAAALFGPVCGFFTGFAGHLLIGLAEGSIRWSFILASGLFGLSFGTLMRDGSPFPERFRFTDLLKFNLFQILSCLFCWCIVAPVLDTVIYTEDLRLLLDRCLFSCIANIATTAVLGTLLCAIYARTASDMALTDKKI